MAANQARVAAEICLSGLIRVGGGHCACGHAVGKGDVMGFFVTATEDRKGRNSGAEEEKNAANIAEISGSGCISKALLGRQCNRSSPPSYY